MRIRLCCVGRLKNAGLEEMCRDYERRIRRHCHFEQLEAKDDAHLLRLLAGDDEYLVGLQVRGRVLTSPGLAARLLAWGERKSGKVTFVIGGADGIPATVASRCADDWSLSALTLPHRLARVLVCEQIYRATSIWRGEPYARED